MLSLYIHIPFCQRKCWYCSFPVIPIEKLAAPAARGEQYRDALFRDIHFWSEELGERETRPVVKTLYIGWWTPLLLWHDYLIRIIDEICMAWDCSQLEELSIECNPFPYDETLASVEAIARHYSTIPRVRFSFGIQSLDDDILTKSGRDCSFAWMQDFTEKLVAIKQPHMLYNYDFIAFGAKTPWLEIHSPQHKRLHTLLHSHQIDSTSLYTLELFAGSQWYHPEHSADPLLSYEAPRDHDLPFDSSEDSIFDEFTTLKQLFVKSGYSRYEISNYSLPWRESIHNEIYWTMHPYLGLGLGAHSLIELPDHTKARCALDQWWKKYVSETDRRACMTVTPLTDDDIMIETFFLWLRTKKGLKDLSSFGHYMVDDWEDRVNTLVTHQLATHISWHLQLTDTGMNIHHRICTHLLKKI